MAIPHRAPVRCLLAPVESTAEGVRVAAVVTADSPGAVAGMVRPGWLIEVAAQACAAGVEAGGTPRVGLLVGVSDWNWHEPVPVDIPLLVTASRGAALGELAEYRCAIHRAGRLVAAGSLQVVLR